MLQIAQTGICNRFHGIEARFCRWLLMADDRSGSGRIALTQEELAVLLGNGRPAVSTTASAFQKKGAIRYRRGTIEILDRKQLEHAACECYEAMTAQMKTNRVIT
jgi:CRP-like cAMP-binding protein